MFSSQSDQPFIEDLEGIESLNSDASKRLFARLPKTRFTLEEALREAGVQNYDLVLNNSKEFAEQAKDEDPEINALGLTDDEAGAISCYTLQGYSGAKPPYQIINESLSGARNRSSLLSTRKLLFLIISGLRKLPRFRPSPGQVLYRGLRAKVPFKKADAEGRQYYEDGRTVTWWGFTSTTLNLKATNNFINGASASTLFNIGGEGMWGYNIKSFSPFSDEEEVLLEPEARILVNGAVIHGTFSVVNVTLQPFDHLVLEEIIPPTNLNTISVQQSQTPAKMVPETKEEYSRKTLKKPEDSEDSAVKPQKENGKKHSNEWNCTWKECPDNVKKEMKYSIDKKNPMSAKIVSDGWCTIIGSTPIPLGKVTSWGIRITRHLLKSAFGADTYIGVAPFDIDQNEKDNHKKCGWYFHCYSSSLYSGPPHNYEGKEYGPKIEEKGKRANLGNGIGVVMNASKGGLSFVLNGVNQGVAYDGIPLDKPLVPCVILGKKKSYVELDLSKVKENVSSSISTPSIIVAKSKTWDSVTLSWDPVEGASFYQVEIDGSIHHTIPTNVFTKRNLPPDTMHNFRVRTGKGNSVSGWSDFANGKTLGQFFETSGWKECPDNVTSKMRYSVDVKNPKAVTKIDFWNSTIIGNTPLPLDATTSWSIKIAKSKNNDGYGIYVGVAPSDINQAVVNCFKDGWYLHCYDWTLNSGAPHNYSNHAYGTRKKDGGYVHTGDNVGITMDTINGDLSFSLDSLDYEIAYTGISLDKPLVPCVVLVNEGDSVEFIC